MGQTFGEQDVLDMIGRIYDAALEPRLWSSVTQRLTDKLNARSGNLYVVDMQCADVGFHAHANIDPAGFRQYEEHYVALDVWNDWFLQAPPDRPYLTQQIFSDQAFARTEFCNDFLRPNDIFYAVGGFVLNQDGLCVLSGVHRPQGAEPFGELELRIMDTLFPHMARALQLTYRLELLKTDRDAGADALDRLPMGVILVDRGGRVVAINRAAQAIVARNDGLASVDRGLVAATQAETAALRRLIAQATQTSQGRGLHPGGALALSRPSMLRPLSVLVAPLGRKAAGANDLDLGRMRPAAVVFVSDPEARQETPAALLARLYGLTPAEARLAEALAGGGPLTAAAERLGIGRETARSQLKQVYAKTGTHRQAELARLLLTSPATIDR